MLTPPFNRAALSLAADEVLKVDMVAKVEARAAQRKLETRAREALAAIPLEQRQDINTRYKTLRLSGRVCRFDEWLAAYLTSQSLLFVGLIRRRARIS